MILARAPLRVSFLGGGSDYPEHYMRHGGATLAAAIDRYTHVLLNRAHPSVPYRYRVVTTAIDAVADPSAIRHPAIRAAFRHDPPPAPLELYTACDIPSGTGLGSSSSFTVALLAALDALQGRPAAGLAARAIAFEQEILREKVGVQDQTICAEGGIRLVRIAPGGAIEAIPIPVAPLTRLALAASSGLYFLGRRRAQQVLGTQLERTRRGDLTGTLRRLALLACDGAECLQRGDVAGLGALVAEGWSLKRRFAPETAPPAIDALIAQAQTAGAWGAKLCGAGGTGFMLVMADPARWPALDAALAPARRLTVEFSGEREVIAR